MLELLSADIEQTFGSKFQLRTNSNHVAIMRSIWAFLSRRSAAPASESSSAAFYLHLASKELGQVWWCNTQKKIVQDF